MSRRAHRRRYAILGLLHEFGPQTASELCALLRVGNGTIYPDLVGLEADGLIAAEWVRTGGDRPGRRRYGVTTPEQRVENDRGLAEFLAEAMRGIADDAPRAAKVPKPRRGGER